MSEREGPEFFFFFGKLSKCIFQKRLYRWTRVERKFNDRAQMEIWDGLGSVFAGNMSEIKLWMLSFQPLVAGGARDNVLASLD